MFLEKSSVSSLQARENFWKRRGSVAKRSLIFLPARALSSSACQRGDLVQSQVGEGTGEDILIFFCFVNFKFQSGA